MNFVSFTCGSSVSPESKLPIPRRSVPPGCGVAARSGWPERPSTAAPPMAPAPIKRLRLFIETVIGRYSCHVPHPLIASGMIAS